MTIKYKRVEKKMTMIEDHIILPKELVDQFQKVLEETIANDDQAKRIQESMQGYSKGGAPPKVIKIALDTDQGWGLSFIIDIAPRSVEEVQKDK